jgi:hypothetical protein
MAEPYFNEWVPPSDISDIFFKKRCCITDIAKALNIHRDTLYEHLKKNPELKATFDKVREDLNNEWMDQSEKVIWYVMSLAEARPGLALKAATYITDKRGKSRGWEGPASESEHAPKLDELFDRLAKQQDDYSARKTAETSSNAESKS